MKYISKLLALVLVFCLVLSIGVVSFAASGEPSGEPSGEASGEPSGEASGEAAGNSIENMKVAEYGSNNSFRRDDTGFIYIGYDVVDGVLTANSNWTGDPANIVLDNEVEGEGFTAVRAVGADTEVNVTGKLVLSDSASGEHASDFSGVGAALNAYNYAKMNVENVDITTDGFVRAALILDNQVVVNVKDSSFVTYGANPLTEAYDGYANSATTSKMLSPPWVLGIQGGIRTVNVLNTNATLVVQDSYLASGGWGVISTDGCTGPVIYVVDSELEILPESEGGMNSGWEVFGFDEDAYGSGYGAYIIGKVDEQNYGVEINGATFGAICREGDVSYASSNGTLNLVDANGNALDPIEGQGKPSVLNTVFGAMTHSSENVSVSYLDGTVVNSAKATILYRSSGVADFKADNAELNPGNGIILQMIDDDDSTVGMGDFSTMGFNTELVEKSGLPSENGECTGESSSQEMAILTLTNGDYAGNVYNGTGYYGQGNDVLNVIIGSGATLDGQIALTETIHGLPYTAEAIAALDKLENVEYELMDADFNVIDGAASGEQPAFIHILRFTIDEYYLLCELIDHVYYNGYSLAQVQVNGGVWNVTEDSLLTYLKIDGGIVAGEVTENADGTITVSPSDKLLTEGEWGEYVEVEIAEAAGMGNATGFVTDASGEASAEPASEEPASAEPASAEPASAEPAAAAADTSEAAYQEYLHQWLIAEDEVNETMTEDIRENEFMPLIYAGDYETFPAEMLWNGMLNNGSPLTYEQWVAEQGAAAPAAGGASWADYQEYLIEAAGKNAPNLDEFKGQVYSFNDWDSIPQDQSPWDQLFTTVGISTWEEFQQGTLKSSLVEGAMG